MTSIDLGKQVEVLPSFRSKKILTKIEILESGTAAAQVPRQWQNNIIKKMHYNDFSVFISYYSFMQFLLRGCVNCERIENDASL